ncbi:Fe-S cluster assembly sulfur transfer protein SufU [Oceanithermus sp.]
MSLLEELYREAIMLHAKNPRNFGELPGADVVIEGRNTSCGDEITLFLKTDGEIITEITFTGHGCAISQSSASMMTERVKGRKLSEARDLIAKFKEMVVEGKPPAAELGDLRALEGTAKLPARVKCATLAWNALEEALLKLEEA